MRTATLATLLAVLASAPAAATAAGSARARAAAPRAATSTAPRAAAAPAETTPALAGRRAPDLNVRPLVPGHGGDTRCVACHVEDGWKDVKFAHERTGFRLEGRHQDAACRACHASGTFADPVPRACAACHRDVHQGRLGPRCDTCHDPTAWSTPSFGPDAHRRTNFPLTGRHAFIACQDCHGDRRDRAFQRPTARCVACHQADQLRASSAASAVNHDAAGFPAECRSCHGTWRFSPAGLPAHQACFSIKSGPHSGIRCRNCHSSIPTVDYTQPFTCATDTADCMRCHGDPAARHQGVQGYQPVNRKCYECHRFASAP